MPYADILPARNETVETRLARINAELRDASAQTVLRASLIREWPGKIAYVCSFGAESAAMLALIADVAPDMPILFMETRRHFAQTLQYRDELIGTLGLTNVVNVFPDDEEEKAEDAGRDLWKRDSDACCELRKVRPLDRVLEGYDAWITGRKRFHGGERMRLPVFEHAGGRFKVNPLAGWTREDVEAFFVMRGLPRHPLVAEGYPSVGCWPCTAPVSDPADVRAGRWAGQEKTECGLHVERGKGGRRAF